MKSIVMSRGAGKTWAIIDEAIKTKKTILCPTLSHKNAVLSMMKDRGVRGLEVLCWNEFERGSAKTREVLVDNMDVLLKYILTQAMKGTKIELATMTEDTISSLDVY